MVSLHSVKIKIKLFSLERDSRWTTWYRLMNCACVSRAFIFACLSVGSFILHIPQTVLVIKKKKFPLHDLLLRTVSSGNLKFMEYIKRKLWEIHKSRINHSVFAFLYQQLIIATLHTNRLVRMPSTLYALQKLVKIL